MKQPFWNSSNIIKFQTIYPLKQTLDGRQQADRFHRKAEIIPLRCQRGSSIEQLSWNSSTSFSKPCPLEQKLDGRQQADRLHRKAEIIQLRCQRGTALNSHLGILQTSSSKPYVLLSRNLMRDASQNKFRIV